MEGGRQEKETENLKACLVLRILLEKRAPRRNFPEILSKKDLIFYCGQLDTFCTTLNYYQHSYLLSRNEQTSSPLHPCGAKDHLKLCCVFD